MLATVFYWALNMSITASVMGCVVLLLRKIRAIPRRAAAVLWAAPFLRFCVPLGVSSPISLMALFGGAVKTVPVYRAETWEFSAANVIQAAENYTPMRYRTERLAQVFFIAGLVWVIVALAILLAMGIVYTATKREIRDARRLEKNVFLSPKVESPAVYGLWKPRIVLPALYEGRDLRYVLQHENTHIRRGDNWWRLLGFAVAAIHWFNPLAWLFLKRFLADLELACDECAVSHCSPEERKEYARALLDCAEQKSLFASAFGGAKIRTRVEHILSYRQMTGFAGICLAVLVGAILFVMLVNAG